MEYTKRAIYIGSDNAYFSEVQTTFSPVDDTIYYIKSIDSTQIILSAILEVVPTIILFEASELEKNDENAEKFLYIMRMLKASNNIGSCLFIAIFESKEQKEKLSYIFSHGFNVGVIKSDDLSSYNDFFYFIGGADSSPPSFAVALFDEVEYVAKVQLDITSVTDNYLQISSDIKIDNWKEEIFFKIFEDYKVVNYRNIKCEDCCHSSDFLYNYTLMFPYAGPNEEVGDDSLYPEMIETWLDLNRCRMKVRQCSLMILSVDISYALAAYTVSENCNVDAYFFRRIKEDENPLLDLLPDIIMLDMTEIEDVGISISKLIEAIQSVDAYQPMIVTFGNISTSEATQKAFSYFNMFAVKNNISHILVEQLVDIYSRSSYGAESEEVVRFNLSDNRRMGKLNLPVKVTSLSEQFITFACKEDIPFFTNVFLDAPCQIMAIIVPPFRELETVASYKHYIALIHCYTHEDKQILRRFVNQCIFSPSDSFEYVEVEVGRDEGYFIRPEGSSDEEAEVETASTRFDSNKIAVTGKSKL